jgi:RHS repeat-associated protein
VYDAASRTLAAINQIGKRTTSVYDAADRLLASIDPLSNRTSTGYDPVGRATVKIDALARRTTTVYDLAGRAVAVIDPLLNRTSTVYDAASRTLASIDALSRRTTSIYDAAGRMLARLDALGFRASTVYDNANRAVAAIDQLAKRTTTVYDSANRNIASVNPLGYRTSTVYDAANEAVATIDALGNRTTSVFDAAGRSIARVDPLGNRTTSIYDAASRVLATLNALSLRASTVYDAAGRAIAAINARGYRTTTGYDGTGAVVVTVDPLLGRTSNIYDAASRQIAVQNALGYRTSTVYLATDLTAATIDQLAGRTSFSYDLANRQIAVKNALGYLNTTVYDPTGAVIANIDPLNRRTTTGYDSRSRPIVRRDALNNRTTTVYDAVGRTLATVNALANRVSSTYDAAGRRIRLTDANGKITTFLFDALARDMGSIDPLLRRVTFAYDTASNRTLKLDPRGNRISYTFDALNRPSAERYPTRRVTFGYDAVNNRTRLNDSTGIYTYTFDAKNRATLAMNPDSKRITYSFDLLDRRTVVRDPDGGRFTYSHDAKDRLAAIVNPQGKRTSFTYDLLDQLTQQKHGNGSLTTNLYDAASQKTRLINASSAGAIVNRFTYSYDNARNRTNVVESSGDRTTWTYDATYQLKHEKRTGGTAFDVTYSYDPAGNRALQIDSGTRITYAFDAANQLLTQKPAGSGTTTFSYDNSGNRSQMNAAGVLTFYTWDENSRLTQAVPVASPVTLSYTGDGRRVKKTVGANVRKFIYDFEKVLQETDGTNTTQKEYTSTEEQYGDLLSDFTGGASTYYEFDGLGSTDALVNDAQTATDRYTYRAFGLANHTQGTTANNDFDFVGRQGYFKDPEINLYFVRARYYDYATGRWVTEDPVGYSAGDANLYRYAGNNPVNVTDPSGLAGCGLLEPPPVCQARLFLEAKAQQGLQRIQGGVQAVQSGWQQAQQIAGGLRPQDVPALIGQGVQQLPGLASSYLQSVSECAKNIGTTSWQLAAQLASGKIHSLADLFNWPAPGTIRPPDALRLILAVLDHPCAQVVPSLRFLKAQLTGRLTKEQLLYLVDLLWQVTQDPWKVLDRIKKSKWLQQRLRDIPAKLSELGQRVLDAIINGLRNLPQTIKSVLVSAVGDDLGFGGRQNLASGLQGQLTEAVLGAKTGWSTFLDIALQIGRGIVDNVVAKAEGFVESVRTGEIWLTLLCAAGELIWPIGWPIPCLTGWPDDIKAIFKVITEAGWGSFDHVVENLLKLWGIGNTIFARLSIWLILASTIYGAIATAPVGGVGASLGVVAYKVSLGVLISSIVQQAVILLKRLYELFSDGALTREQWQDKIADVTNSIIFEIISAVMFLLGSAATRFAARVVALLKRFFKQLPPGFPMTMGLVPMTLKPAPPTAKPAKPARPATKLGPQESIIGLGTGIQAESAERRQHPCDKATPFQPITLIRGGRAYPAIVDLYWYGLQRRVCRVRRIDGSIIPTPTSPAEAGSARQAMRATIFGRPPAPQAASYDAGHLIADELGGPNEAGNLVPILRVVNQAPGAWRKMENWIKNCLKQPGMEGIMEVVVSYNESAPGVDKYIPTSFSIQVLLSTAPATSRIHPFTIANSPSAIFAAPTRCV